tara:strand:- start:394 stop:573 length:180 start_codon:yes stop_codon:yes gene_type:complete
MICFRDMTFCWSNCTNTACHRYFGEEEQKAAEDWWEPLEGEPPVAFSDFSSTCPDYKEH